MGGITFAFDPSKAPGSRIDPAFIKIGSEYMDKDQHYKMATKAALASGEEGYTALSQGHLAHYVRDAFYSLEELLLPVFMFIIYALQEWFWLTTSAGRASPRPCSTTSRQSASRSWRMTRRPGQRSWCRYTSSVSSPGQYHHHHHHYNHNHQYNHHHHYNL